MKKPPPSRGVLAALTTLATLGLAAALGAANAGAEGKVPFTTSSKEARAAYLEARDLAERLRGPEARPIYERAIAADPGFALAWLGLANTQPSAREFFEKLDKAVALADKVSLGERLMILGAQAGASGDNATQVELYAKLVAAYPQDERALVLLGNAHFGAQRYEKAIGFYERARKIDPGFSQIYNQLGYSYRFLGRMDEAEQAFTDYTRVLPQDPNPHDSLAELLLKRGRFDPAIASYRKALAVRPDFVNSYLGIATCLDLQGKGAEARAELDRMLAIAADDGQRRTALFGRTVSWVHEGNLDAAQTEMQKQLAIATAAHDALGMAGDHNAMGSIALTAGDADGAERHFREALKVVVESPKVAEANKENARRLAHYNEARVALARGDLATAKTASAALAAAVAERGNPFQVRLSHEIAGRIALAEKRWSDAIAEFGQANRLNPLVRSWDAQAHAGLGETATAEALANDALNDNSLTNLNLARLRQMKPKG